MDHTTEPHMWDTQTSPAVRLHHPGDALALVQHVFGHIPRQSLVLIGVTGGTSGGHLRIDLPPALDHPQMMAQRCAQWLAGADASPVPQACLAMVFDEDPPRCGGCTLDELLAALREALEHLGGIRLLHIWHVTGGRIRDYACQDPQCCPPEGHAISTVLEQTYTRLPHLAPVGETHTPEEMLAEYLAPSTALSSDQVEGVVQAAQAAEVQHCEAVLTLWDAALRRSCREQHAGWIHTQPQRTAPLLATLRRSVVADWLKPLATMGYLTALAGAYLDQVTGEGVCVRQDYLPAVMEHLPDRITEEQAAQLLVDCAAAAEGATPHPPDWLRVEALDLTLRELLPYAQGYQRQTILCLKGWIEWIRGRGSVASVAVETVLTEAPDSTPATALRRLIARYPVCDWARVKRHSYSWWAANGRVPGQQR
ncbi:DUF4192 family protein [Nesterenkonia alba]|uniref:DUF4192 family protein n=1 Tax=Nesterenkonia alba TaxID=515814 RepID=UPI0003B5CA58|nr:DUF4192 family protein [Nesterenkonia alba]